MTLTQIKEQLNAKGFNFSRCLDEAKEPTQFLRHWDAKERYALVIHQDLMAHIKANPKETKLALKWKQGETKPQYDDAGNITNEDTAGMLYDNWVLIKSDKIEESI